MKTSVSQSAKTQTHPRRPQRSKPRARGHSAQRAGSKKGGARARKEKLCTFVRAICPLTPGCGTPARKRGAGDNAGGKTESKGQLNNITIYYSTHIMAYVIGDDCVACGTCIDECPSGAISEGEKYSIAPDVCVDCGTCADVCPSGAIAPGE